MLFKHFSSKNLEEGWLESPGRWKSFWRARGDTVEDDVVDACLEDADLAHNRESEEGDEADERVYFSS